MKLFNHRKLYDKDSLSLDEIGDNPINFFKKWFKEAEKSDQIIESNAMTVSTIDESNKPSSRVVLLKEIKEDSLIFFTNYKSKKGMAIDKNPNISASFYWAPLERQVIFKGIAKKTSDKYSDIYFKSRPFSSQVGAIVSNQSQIISSYDELLIKYDKFLNENKGSNLNRPNHWGGIELVVQEIEFWQGRENRLHNRVISNLRDDKWEHNILSP
jgi:pyridoxamine 5'-phosphate oxidase